MKLEETKTKVCPLIFDVITQGNINCITSECMAWKWNDIYSGNIRFGFYPSGKVSATEGYCIRLYK